MLPNLRDTCRDVTFRLKLSKEGEQTRLISVSLDDSLLKIIKNCCDVYRLDSNSMEVQFFSTQNKQFLDLYEGTWPLFAELLRELLSDLSILPTDVRFCLVLVVREAIGKPRSG